MTIESISSVSAVADAGKMMGTSLAPQKTDFAGWLEQQINVVNNQIQTAEVEVVKLAAGQSGNLHEVMLSLEKAKLSFELMMQVRNKLLEGYQEVMRMQI